MPAQGPALRSPHIKEKEWNHPPGDSDCSAEKHLWLQGKMEQINQGAAAKPPASGHQGGFLEYISVSKVPRNHLISTIPAARVTRKQSASVPETGRSEGDSAEGHC